MRMNVVGAWAIGACLSCMSVSAVAEPVLKLGVIGLVHNHVGGFFNGGALAPAGGILHRKDVQLVGIVEPDNALFEKYAAQYHLPASLHYRSIAEMAAQAHPQAVLVFTAPDQHRRVVEESAKAGINVLMEKPLAFTYADALAIKRAAESAKIHVLVNYETSWYTSNYQAYTLLRDGALGPIMKTVMRDGHEGPVKIGVSPEFLSLLVDPKQDGDGALTDFGCYGPDLMTWLMHGEVPKSVTAVTKSIQPELYPKVDDESDIILNYASAVSIIEGSWDWPFAFKQMDLYGRTGYAKAIDPKHIEVRKQHEEMGTMSEGAPIPAPNDDPIHFLEAVMSGQIDEGDSVSGLKTNMTVTEILDAARTSAKTGKTVMLPLPQ